MDNVGKYACMSVRVCVHVISCDAADGFAMREGVRRVTHGGVCRVRELYCAILWAEGVYFISSQANGPRGRGPEGVSYALEASWRR